MCGTHRSTAGWCCRLTGCLVCVVAVTGLAGAAPVRPSDFTPEQARLAATHVYGGIPCDQPVAVRHGYVLCYDDAHRVPAWVAYRVTPDCLKKPPRKGVFSSFRKDADFPRAPSDAEYVGQLDKLGYARGHLVPYGVAGGDRDGDGRYAIRDRDGDGVFSEGDAINAKKTKYALDDEYDRDTIYQVNMMGNIAPQQHAGFNGSGGLWYDVERYVQDTVVRQHGHAVFVFAGCIVGPGEVQRAGKQEDIGVPSLFYKIVIHPYPEPGRAPLVLAFLLPHQRVRHGDIQDFLVSVDVIENLTGLDFFWELEDGIEGRLEADDSWIHWADFLK